MRKLRHIWPLRAVVVLLAVAFATSGFAHRMVTPADQSLLSQAWAYGIEASDICGGGDADQASRGCDACRLNAAMSLPEPGFAVRPAGLDHRRIGRAPQPPLLPSLSAEARRPARAPPLV